MFSIIKYLTENSGFTQRDLNIAKRSEQGLTLGVLGGLGAGLKTYGGFNQEMIPNVILPMGIAGDAIGNIYGRYEKIKNPDAQIDETNPENRVKIISKEYHNPISNTLIGGGIYGLKTGLPVVSAVALPAGLIYSGYRGQEAARKLGYGPKKRILAALPITNSIVGNLNPDNKN